MHPLSVGTCITRPHSFPLPSSLFALRILRSSPTTLTYCHCSSLPKDTKPNEKKIPFSFLFPCMPEGPRTLLGYCMSHLFVLRTDAHKEAREKTPAARGRLDARLGNSLLYVRLHCSCTWMIRTWQCLDMCYVYGVIYVYVQYIYMYISMYYM